MATEEQRTQSTSAQPRPWITYIRRADNVRVSARLIEREGEKFLEVKESNRSDFCCPNCKYLLTQRDTKDFPNFVLEPKIFHEFHKPLDPSP